MPLRLRFVFGKDTGTTGERTRSFAATLARQVAFSAAENMYKDVRQEIAASFQRDAKRELTHLMALYRRHIIGAGGSKRRPSGMLSYALGSSDTGVGDDDQEVAIAASLPEWAPRSPAYLRQKKRLGWSQTWFSARGDLSKDMRADVMLAAYGPVRVSIIRDRGEMERIGFGGTSQASRFTGTRLRTFGPNAAPAAGLSAADQQAARIRLQVATVRVFAMTAITPSMLPALANGDPTTENSDDPARGRRFIEPLRAVAPGAAYRLGRLSYNTHRYRPTLEPFLAWYLTRAIPNALALRLQEGAIGRARRGNVVRR